MRKRGFSPSPKGVHRFSQRFEVAGFKEMNEHSSLKQDLSGKTAKRCRAPLVRGFTLVELLVVIGFMAVLLTIGTLNYFGERGKRQLELTTEIIVREINSTASKSKSQEGDSGSQWWLIFRNPLDSGNDYYIVCYGIWSGPGDNCVVSGGNESKRVNLGNNLEFTDPASGGYKNMVFEKATGLPTATTTVEIKSTTGAGSRTITANTNGRIDF